MDLGVAGQAFLIVGGTAGIGLETARALVADGATVAVLGRDRERGEAAAAALCGEHGSRVVAVVGDVASGQDTVDALVREVTERVGPLAGLAVTAGSNRDAHSTLEQATDDIWDRSFQEQLMGTVRSVKAVLPGLRARGGGTIVTCSAYSIHSPHHNRMPYVALKSGVASFTKNVAKSYGAEGVRANCVCPGAIVTDNLTALRRRLAQERGVPEEGLIEQVMRDEWHMDVALGRPGRPEEVGELVAFLLSGRAAYLTGALVNIDGGTDF